MSDLYQSGEADRKLHHRRWDFCLAYSTPSHIATASQAFVGWMGKGELDWLDRYLETKDE